MDAFIHEVFLTLKYESHRQKKGFCPVSLRQKSRNPQTQGIMKHARSKLSSFSLMVASSVNKKMQDVNDKLLIA